MFPRQRAEVVGIAGQHNGATKADCRRNDRCIHGMARVETISSEKAAGGTGNPMVERHDSIRAPNDTVDRCIATSAPVDLCKDRRWHAHQRVPPCRFCQDRLCTANGDAALVRAGERAQGLAVEDEERRHRASGAALARPRLVCSLDLIERGRSFGHQPLVRRAEDVLQLRDEVTQLRQLELVADRTGDEPAHASGADPLLHGVNEVLLHGHGDLPGCHVSILLHSYFVVWLS